MSIYEFSVHDIAGEEVSLGEDRFRNKVIIIVNTASQCGLKDQLKDLEVLYRKYRDQGLLVLAFPCEQFKKQEPLDGSALATCYRTDFEVDYPVFAKLEVNGPGAHPLFTFLKDVKRGPLGSKRVLWNFTKWLVDSHGIPVARYAPTTKPKKLEKRILELLSEIQ
eukprot:gnl/Dysnectes_brevis/517_a573_5789.p1 GENE.gnl/Dysnectes_brevis/517_a573_5789~~gnl/Dysnectes_brevis/517_a573_5789.p1  ORF type:complete len:165 (+),score=40.94 gnl/Dysnectes_brevis/517_a573_5789:322-816(+)